MTTIRRAGTDDASLLHAVAAATFRLACPAGTAEEDMAAFIRTSLSEERMAGYLADERRRLYVAEDDPEHGGEPVGYTMLLHADPDDPEVAAVVHTRPTAELSKCYVVAGRHGAGVASALVDATVSEARMDGASSVWLGVNRHNVRANRFYEKHGFALVGHKHFQLGEDRQEDYVRELVF